MATIDSYDPDLEPTFTAWSDPRAVTRFESALRVFLANQRQPREVLTERVKLHSMIEELLASPSSKTLRQGMERLRSEGLSRGQAIDALVALAASFHGTDDDVAEQVRFLEAVRGISRDVVESTFGDGPVPVIATRLQLRPKA